MNMIETENLARQFAGRYAVAGLTLQIEAGKVFGFLGPNGAGKTTTIRILTGQLKPTSGWARVAGFDVVSERSKVKERIGVVFEYQNLYERMTVRENLAFIARLYKANLRRVDEILEAVALQERAKDRVPHLSNGMRQRLLIARALIHQPQLIFLDEPTRGLDPARAGEIRRLLSELASQGVTLFLTTHYMEEADHLCQEVAILNEGRIVAMDTPQHLKTSYGKREVIAMLQGGQQRTLVMDNVGDAKRLEEFMSNGDLLTVHSAEATLEEVFLALTGRRLAE